MMMSMHFCRYISSLWSNLAVFTRQKQQFEANYKLQNSYKSKFQEASIGEITVRTPIVVPTMCPKGWRNLEYLVQLYVLGPYLWEEMLYRPMKPVKLSK